MNALWVFLGGGIGSAIRYFLGIIFQRTTLALPLATLSANVSSCIVFGITLWIVKDKIEYPSTIRLFILTGICGGLSTFSTFSFETFELFRSHQFFWACTNIIVNTILCLLIFYIFSKLY